MAYVSNPKGPAPNPKATGSIKKGKTTSPGVVAIKGTLGFIGRIIATVILVGVITGCIVATVMSIYVLQLVNTNDVIDLRNFKQNYTSIIYAENPETGETYELQRLVGGENRIWVGIDKIPKCMQQAVIAIEDKRFDDKVGPAHSGVDWKRTLYATANYFVSFSARTQGGSTLTQQLIKNITGEDEVSIPRKVQEIFRAINLEKVYSKDDILEAYLNTIALGNNTNGVQAAANLYFNKDVQDLTLMESCALASITQYPEKYNPFAHPENNKERREYVLLEMLNQGRITQQEYDNALKEPITFKKQEAMQQKGSKWNWFVENLIDEIISDLMTRKGMTKQQAETKLFSGGLRIYTTMNPMIQQILDEKFLNDETFKAVTNKEPPQSAMAIIDPHGKILGIAGQRGEKVSDRGFNYATMAKRQPGSSIKPIATYSQAIELGIVNYSSPIEDSPMSEKKNGDEVLSSWPKNHYAGYKENMTVVRAIQNSTNTVAVKVLDMLTPRRAFDFMKNKLGITTLVEARKQNGQVFSDLDLSPLGLGALTDGVTVLQMTGAYQIFANGGTYTKPYSYTQVLDAATGEVVLENKGESNRVISDETAYIMNRLLYQVVNGATEGTGRAAKVKGAEVVGKTGTSDDNYNQWFIGCTPKYVAALWIGYDRNKEVTYSSSYPPVNAWKQVMQEVVKLDKDPGTFPVSDGVVQEAYCVETGELASPYCPTTAIGYYSKNNLPNICTKHLNAGTSTTDPFAATSSNFWE